MSANQDKLSNFAKKSRNRHRSNLSLPGLYCYHFLLLALQESGTRKVLLGPLLNNTDSKSHGCINTIYIHCW